MGLALITLLVLVTFVVLTPAEAEAQAPPMRPGMWAISVQMSMPNLPVEMPPISTTQCVTPDMLQSSDFFAGGPLAGPTGAVDESQTDCMLEDSELNGQTLTWRMSCTQPQVLTVEGEVTFTDDRYVGTMISTTPQGPMTMMVDARRTGNCE